MTTSEATLRAVICEDDAALGAVLSDTIKGLFDIDIAATVGTGAEAVAAVGRVKPDLVVIDLALGGELGLGIVAALKDAAPRCSVVVLAEPNFSSLRAAAAESGAMTLLALSDLRPLHEHLRDMRTSAGLPCADRIGPGSTVTTTGDGERPSSGYRGDISTTAGPLPSSGYSEPTHDDGHRP